MLSSCVEECLCMLGMFLLSLPHPRLHQASSSSPPSLTPTLSFTPAFCFASSRLFLQTFYKQFMLSTVTLYAPHFRPPSTRRAMCQALTETSEFRIFGMRPPSAPISRQILGAARIRPASAAASLSRAIFGAQPEDILAAPVRVRSRPASVMVKRPASATARGHADFGTRPASAAGAGRSGGGWEGSRKDSVRVQAAVYRGVRLRPASALA